MDCRYYLFYVFNMTWLFFNEFLGAWKKQKVSSKFPNYDSFIYFQKHILKYFFDIWYHQIIFIIQKDWCEQSFKDAMKDVCLYEKYRA